MTESDRQVEGYLQRPLPDPLDLELGALVERFSDDEERPSDNGLLYARSGPMMSREEVEELQRRLEG